MAAPTSLPTFQPISRPSRQPTGQPSSEPSTQPTSNPTQPTGSPSSRPSQQPSSYPSSQPSSKPFGYPTTKPSSQPTSTPAAALIPLQWFFVDTLSFRSIINVLRYCMAAFSTLITFVGDQTYSKIKLELDEWKRYNTYSDSSFETTVYCRKVQYHCR